MLLPFFYINLSTFSSLLDEAISLSLFLCFARQALLRLESRACECVRACVYVKEGVPKKKRSEKKENHQQKKKTLVDTNTRLLIGRRYEDENNDEDISRNRGKEEEEGEEKEETKPNDDFDGKN